MQCEQVKAMLSSYIDGMTSEKDNIAISAHLEDCSQCRQELEHLRAICIALKNLPLPELPESFAEDLRKHLVEEKTILFGHRKIKKPKKQGWIAASVAGVALIVGIYASSTLAPMIASWQDKHNKAEDNKPSLAIDGIVSCIRTEKEEKPTNVAQAPEEKSQETQITVNADSKKITPQNTGGQDSKPEEVAVSTTKVITPKLADVLSTRLKVHNAGDSLKQVVQLAQSNGWNYEYTNNGAVPQALSGPNANGLAIKVNKNDVDKVIAALDEFGKASSPMRGQVELTGKYSELENRINSLQEEKQNLQQAENPDQAKLSEIERQIQDSLKQKAALDKELQIVTVNIYFVEEVNP